jgi:hypothetical protein
MYKTREEWLEASVEELRERFFIPYEVELDAKISVSTGWTSKGSKTNRIGECWPPEVTKNGSTHIFITPTLLDPIEVLATLLHELVHASLRCEHGHGKPFVKIIRKFGLEGKPKATYAAENSDCWHRLKAVADKMGEYPHDSIRVPSKQMKPRGLSSQMKFRSQHNPEYIVRIAQKIFDEHGAPKDPWGQEMVEFLK